MSIYIYFLQDNLGAFWYVREHRAIFIVLVDNCAIKIFSFKIMLFSCDFIGIYNSCCGVVDFSEFQSYCCWLLFRMIMKWLWSGYLEYGYFIFFTVSFLVIFFLKIIKWKMVLRWKGLIVIFILSRIVDFSRVFWIVLL